MHGSDMYIKNQVDYDGGGGGGGGGCGISDIQF